jgi:hypothetical protein
MVSSHPTILKNEVISSAHNLITVVQTVRRKLHTTLNNIWTVLKLTGIELRTLKSPYIQSVMLTFPLYHPTQGRRKAGTMREIHTGAKEKKGAVGA